MHIALDESGTSGVQASIVGIPCAAARAHVRSIGSLHHSQEYMVPWLGGCIPESTHDKYWESAFYNRLLVRMVAGRYKREVFHVVAASRVKLHEHVKETI